MKPIHRNRRLGLVVGGGVLLAAAAGLVFTALKRNISYFYTPSEAQEAGVAPDTRIRLGGLVETGSVEHGDGLAISFRVTDGTATMPVTYAGIVPDLFREGQGVIAQGAFNAEGVFVAQTILAKHDENYIPKELQGISHELPAENAPLTN
ncbi:cytochrome c maturation protein CcmE [Hyphococcus luteus]|uniref:Cytochrome c-type biogenesis protein CcmE n=1 Tax=Hyphococcus luteus TaxID=2058213 RepID=A0A2S7JZ62_9PROT|nr:cytochrome c maturation protein CcmE [Marinicaulis flavus]PQA85544.1 cytochrome c maturation protein CcmE [Marinicaulis flavus]